MVSFHVALRCTRTLELVVAGKKMNNELDRKGWLIKMIKKTINWDTKTIVSSNFNVKNKINKSINLKSYNCVSFSNDSIINNVILIKHLD